MRKYRLTRIAAVLWLGLCATVVSAQTAAPKDQNRPANPEDQVLRQVAQNLAQAFNRGQAQEVSELFLPEGELKDDAGNVHQGRPQIAALLAKFFERFPGAQAEMQVASIRMLGTSLAIQEGTQTVVTKDSQTKSVNRFTAVLTKTAETWRYASFQESPEEQEPTPHDRLQPLAWMVGDWVDEDSDAVITIKCRWSDEENFLLVRYESKVEGKTTMKSSQWIGWDPLHQRVRSWVFDSDGGHGEGHWTLADTSWILKSTAVMPDGQTGSATIIIEPQGQDKFVMRGLDRILGDDTQPDFQVTIVRQPPQPMK